MKKYVEMLRYEFKNILRDKMTATLLVYPLLIILLGSYILPLILEEFGEGGSGQYTASIVIVIVFGSLAPFVTGGLLAFSLLDHKDENTLITIRVTPLSLKGYLTFKATYAYILAVNASFWTIFGTKYLSGDRYTVMGVNVFEGFTFSNIILYALVAGLFAPVFGLIVSGIAKNKIEGFAYLKSTGIFAMLPALVVLNTMQGAKQYFLGIFPTFWPIKGLLMDANLLTHDANLTFTLYLIIGVLYMIGLILLAYKAFERKVQT